MLPAFALLVFLAPGGGLGLAPAGGCGGASTPPATGVCSTDLISLKIDSESRSQPEVGEMPASDVGDDPLRPAPLPSLGGLPPAEVVGAGPSPPGHTCPFLGIPHRPHR